MKIKSYLNKLKHHQRTTTIVAVLLFLTLAPAVYITLRNAGGAEAASLTFSSDGTDFTIAVANRYSATIEGDGTDDYIMFTDSAQGSNQTHEFASPCITESSTLYCLRHDTSRKMTLLESTTARVKVRVEGKFGVSTGGGSYLQDGGSENLTVVEEYTFTPEGVTVHNSTDFRSTGITLDADSGHNGYEWLGVYTDVTDGAFDDTGNLIFGDGETELTTSVDGTDVVISNTYTVLPGSGSDTYQDAFIGMTRSGQFDDNASGLTHEWHWDEGQSGTQDLLTIQAQAGSSATTGVHQATWFFMMKAEDDLDTEAEREALANDLRNPDLPTYTTGSQWVDYSSSKSLGTSGAPGGASSTLYFDGVNDGVTVSPDSSLEEFTQVTLSSWIYPSANAQNAGSRIITKTVNGGDDDYALMWSDNGKGGDPQGIRVRITTSGETNFDYNNNTLLKLNRWYHIVGVYDGSEIRAYINGNEVGTPLSKTGTIQDSNDTLSIGTHNDDPGSRRFNGRIEDARIYNVALTQNEIRQIMAGNTNVHASNLAAHWTFNENVGTSIYDSTNNNNDGVFLNDPTWTTGYVPTQYNPAEGTYTFNLASGNRGVFDLDAGGDYSTLLNGAVTAADTSFTVDSASSFNSSGVAYVNGDKYSYTGTTSTTFTGVPSSGDLSLIGHADNSVAAIMNRHNPFYKLRNWRSLGLPGSVTLEGAVLTAGTDYNAAVKPITDADYYDDSATSYTQLAAGGDTGSANEYLAADGSDYTLAFDSTADYFYLGSDAQFIGLNTDLATLGDGTSPVIAWEYCSDNFDSDTDCDGWTALTVSDVTSGASSFTASGNFNWDDPGNWFPATVNSSTDLYYIRGYLSSGSYTTSPVENLIKTDILLVNYLGTLTAQDQTLAFPSETGSAADASKGGPPLSHWSMDEAQGTTINDALTSSDNDLTLSGATWTVTGAGMQPNQIYLQFDGSDDYLSRSYDGEFDFGTDSFSVAGWFRHVSAIAGTDTLVSRADVVNGVGYKVYMNSSGNLCFGIDDTAGTFPEDSACSSADYSDSSWYHFEAVKDGTTDIKLYIDGQEVGSDTSLGSNASLDADATLYVGMDADGSSNPWDGFVDNIWVYRYARTADQVKADYNGQIPQSGVSF